MDPEVGTVTVVKFLVCRISLLFYLLRFGECAAPYYLQLPAYIISSPGLDPNAVDEEGRTALHLALSSRRFEAARQILNLPGVDVNSEVGTELKTSVQNQSLN